MAVLWRAELSGQRNLRKERCLGDAHVGVGGHQALLIAPHIGPALQQRRRQSGRNFGQVRLLGQVESARDRSGISAQQDADVVLGLFDGLLQA